MTAISKAWVTVADTAVDPDSPIDAALMTGLRDDLVHLREWLGASFTAGAVRNHNHDGSNSAAIEIGPNWLRNGGFSNGTTGWTATAYTGGTVTTGTSDETEGTAGAVITSTNATNGGGKLESNEFIPVVAGQTRQFMMTIKASGSGVRVRAEVLWFNDAQASISNSTIVATTGGAAPTTDRLVVRRIAAPSTAKFCKIRLENPADATGTAGTAYFDAVIVTTPQMLGGLQVFTASGTFGGAVNEPWGDVYVVVQGAGGNGAAVTSASAISHAGGGEGAYSEGWVTVSASVAVTAGSGTNSFGSFISCTAGGTPGTNSSIAGAGGTATGGAFSVPGRSAGLQGALADHGAPSRFGIGGAARTSPGNGNNGTGYGAGGGGSYGNSSGSFSGGTGAPGFVIVRW